MHAQLKRTTAYCVFSPFFDLVMKATDIYNLACSVTSLILQDKSVTVFTQTHRKNNYKGKDIRIQKKRPHTHTHTLSLSLPLSLTHTHTYTEKKRTITTGQKRSRRSRQTHLVPETR